MFTNNLLYCNICEVYKSNYSTRIYHYIDQNKHLFLDNTWNASQPSSQLSCSCVGYLKAFMVTDCLLKKICERQSEFMTSRNCADRFCLDSLKMLMVDDRRKSSLRRYCIKNLMMTPSIDGEEQTKLRIRLLVYLFAEWWAETRRPYGQKRELVPQRPPARRASRRRVPCTLRPTE